MTFQTWCRKPVGTRILLYPTYVAVYAGDSLATLSRLAFSTTYGSDYVTSLTMQVDKGVSYHIVGMLGSSNGIDYGDGTFTLSWSGELSLEQPPAFRIIIR